MCVGMLERWNLPPILETRPASLPLPFVTSTGTHLHLAELPPSTSCLRARGEDQAVCSGRRGRKENVLCSILSNVVSRAQSPMKISVTSDSVSPLVLQTDFYGLQGGKDHGFPSILLSWLLVTGGSDLEKKSLFFLIKIRKSTYTSILESICLQESRRLLVFHVKIQIKTR